MRAVTRSGPCATWMWSPDVISTEPVLTHDEIVEFDRPLRCPRDVELVLRSFYAPTVTEGRPARTSERDRGRGKLRPDARREPRLTDMGAHEPRLFGRPMVVGELARRADGDPVVGSEDQQVAVAGDDHCGVPGDAGMTIVRIRAARRHAPDVGLIPAATAPAAALRTRLRTGDPTAAHALARFVLSGGCRS